MKNKILLYGLSFGIQFFITVVISALTIRYYSSNTAANLFYQLNIVTYLTTLFSLGVPQALLRFQYLKTINSNDLKHVFSIIGIASTIGLAIFCIFLLEFNSVFLIFLVPFTFSQYYLRSIEDLNSFIKLFLLRFLIVFGGAALIFFTHAYNEFWWYLTLGLSFSVGILFYPYSKELNINRITLSSLLKYSVPLQLYSFLLQGVFLFGQILLEKFGEPNEFEKYVITWRVIQILQALGAMIFFFYPQFYFKNLNINKKRVLKVRNFIFIFLILSGVGLLLFKPIIDVLFGIQFQYHLLSVLVLSEVIRLATGINNTKFSFFLKNKYLLYSLLVSVFFSCLILFIIIFINCFSLSSINVAYAILFCFTVYFLTSWILKRRLDANEIDL